MAELGKDTLIIKQSIRLSTSVRMHFNGRFGRVRSRSGRDGKRGHLRQYLAVVDCQDAIRVDAQLRRVLAERRYSQASRLRSNEYLPHDGLDASVTAESIGKTVTLCGE